MASWRNSNAHFCHILLDSEALPSSSSGPLEPFLLGSHASGGGQVSFLGKLAEEKQSTDTGILVFLSETVKFFLMTVKPS